MDAKRIVALTRGRKLGLGEATSRRDLGELVRALRSRVRAPGRTLDEHELRAKLEAVRKLRRR